MMFINSPIIAETTREEHIRLIIQNRRPFLPPMATSPPTLMPKSFKTPNLYRRQHQYHLKQPYLIHQYLNIEHRLSWSLNTTTKSTTAINSSRSNSSPAPSCPFNRFNIIYATGLQRWRDRCKVEASRHTFSRNYTQVRTNNKLSL